MDKSRLGVAVVCLVLFCSLVLNHYDLVQAANTSVTVLSYSSYVSPRGHFVVLGEVQNTHNHAQESVSLNVEVTASDGSQIAVGTTSVYVNNFLPQQKAPFYIDFGKIDFNILSNISTFNISLANAPPTNYIQYPDLSISADSDGIVNEAYTVSGSITNTGSQIANNVKIYATYYNAEGVVVAVGFVNLEDPLTPKTSANFVVTEIDESIKLATKISSYSLLIQTSTQSLWIPPSPSPSDMAQASDSSIWTYVIISVVAITVIVLATLVFLRKRRKSN